MPKAIKDALLLHYGGDRKKDNAKKELVEKTLINSLFKIFVMYHNKGMTFSVPDTKHPIGTASGFNEFVAEAHFNKDGGLKFGRTQHTKSSSKRYPVT